MAINQEERRPMDATGMIGLVLIIAMLAAFSIFAFVFFAGFLPEAMHY